MSRVTQSRAQTEANAKILRALVKSPDNKVCVDCKKNDPRWASWNLGCFLCIRCSGIHRSMGTHISKVKSIDLDIWTPEQMDSVQKWGNRRCNLYWEAHLKPGHIPADHKIESFIRSKYESRRWAKDGPVPSDPSVLDADGGASAAAATTTASSTAAAASAASSAVAAGASGGAPKKSAAVDLLDDPSPTPATTTTRNAAAPTRTAAATSPPAAAPKPSGGGGIFDLDWHDPSPSTVTSPSAASPASTTASGTGAKGKNDIMSLFAAAPPVVPAQSTVSPPHTAGASSAFGDFGNFTSSAPLNNLTSGFGNLDLSSPTTTTTTTNAKPGNSTTMGLGSIGNPWSTNVSTNNSTTGAGTAGNGGLFDTHDVWGSSSTTNTSSSGAAAGMGAKKDDAFADIWGDFK